MAHPIDESKERLPPLLKDGGFFGMVVTQFLGAFNDNIYKQLILLVCVDVVNQGGKDQQGLASGMFALPFVLFSGFAGYLADKNNKKTIFVLCKVAEIVVMLLGVAAFWAGGLYPAIAVVFLMGTHSAFFGPSKYGILPEMLRDRDLPAANGVVQMTTFMAIILGWPVAGFLKDSLPNQLWAACFVCVGIAALGTITSLFVRRTPTAKPDLQLDPWVVVSGKETWRMFFSDRSLIGVLLVYAYFWFVAGVVPQAVNAYGKLQLGVSDFQTSVMTSWMSIGIAVGCAAAGKLSGKKVNFGLVSLGAWGITVLFAALAAVGASSFGATPKLYLTEAVLVVAGVFTGLMAVPLQVYLQVKPPEGEKGQVMGAMNLTTWTGIILASVFYAIASMVVNSYKLALSTIFLACGLLMLPLALLYRPKDYELK
jgi:acyl-[acyl-carrier-protein]-phospholipid O-acyltransferase/long-chain-fatty-acid--[acyl-carrier-protein] ligase